MQFAKAIGGLFLLLCSIHPALLLSEARAEEPTATEDGAQASNEDPPPAPAGRQMRRGPAATGSDDEEYNFSWLDPDKKVYVLQNRRYKKALRPALFIEGGYNLNNPYKQQWMGIPRAAFWFTEWLGVELFYSFIRTVDSDNLSALRNISASALPYARYTTGYFGAVASFSPWYMKLNFFNKILYLDWAINAGGGMVNTQVNTNNNAGVPTTYADNSYFAGFGGTSLNLYLNKSFSVRMDLIGLTYQALGADNQNAKYYFNYDFALGAGFFFF